MDTLQILHCVCRTLDTDFVAHHDCGIRLYYTIIQCDIGIDNTEVYTGLRGRFYFIIEGEPFISKDNIRERDHFQRCRCVLMISGV